MTTSPDKISSGLIKEYAAELGFDLCGIAEAKSLDKHKSVLADWTNAGMNADMAYLGQNIEKRIDPRILVPGAKSLIVTALNYYTEKKQGWNGVPVLSRYAYGENYHNVIKGKLNKMLDYLKSINPDITGRSFVDSAPLLEKAWGREAGLGWPGKHSILINKEIGSFFFLGILIVNIELEYDKPFEEDCCGVCSLCIDSCPTGAINDNKTIDVKKCIAYQTLEAKTLIPDEIVSRLEGRVFGCDKCQEVCPWNKDLKSHRIPAFDLPEEIKNLTIENWKDLTRKDFRRLFKNSTILRRSYCRFMDNIEAATQSRS
jgi:epoxyqueuosine reductase